jgi:hypothetical protein
MLTNGDIEKLISRMQGVFATKKDLVVFPTAEMVKRGFDHVDARFADVNAQLDRIEKTLLADYGQRIEILERTVKELKNALAM